MRAGAILLTLLAGLAGCSAARDSAASDAGSFNADASVADAAAGPPDAAMPAIPDAAIPAIPDAGSTTLPDAAIPDAAQPLDAALSLPDAAVEIPDAATVDSGGDTISPLGNGAQLVSSSFPSDMLTGQQVRASLVFRNTGTTTWRNLDQVMLGSPGDDDPLTDARQPLPSSPVAPGETITFELLLRAPDVPGVVLTDWRMLREHREWFGDTFSQPVTVTLGGCSNPVPPPIHSMKAVIHNDMGYKKVLDSTALVYGGAYCAEIGFTDGRLFCPSRPEGHAQVDVCNALVVGTATDTGRVGPTWTFNDLPCTDYQQEGRCLNHPDNQFLVIVFGSGVAHPCTASGVCGQVVIP